MPSIELTGMDEMLENLRRKLQAAAGRVENQGLRSGGEIIAEGMRSKVNRSRKSGAGYVHMQDDIKVSNVRRKEGVKYILIGPGKKTGWRAHYLEFGTKKARARPFAYPAFHEKKGEAMQAMADEFRKGLSE